MAENEQTSAAEQRAFAVARLKRAASLPRMKDGRRPPMHTEAVSEGEKVANGEAPTEVAEASTSNVKEEVKTEERPPSREEVDAEVDAEVEPVEVARNGAHYNGDDRHTPEPTPKTKRRSRSRSRSRGSRDFKGKARNIETPTPIPGDSSQDESLPMVYPQMMLPVTIPPFHSPTPSRIAELQRSGFLRSPTPTSPEPGAFYSRTASPTPLLPTLEALQKGMLSRSNSAVVGRRMAMHKLTGGKDSYDPSPSPTPPPNGAKLGRNNTVSGGERTAARQLMLSRLGGRFNKDTDLDTQASAGEDIVRAPTPKRRRRRSRRQSASASNTGISDSEHVSTPNTPIKSETPLLPSLDDVAALRALSTTPSHALPPPTPPEPVPMTVNLNEQYDPPERPDPKRRRSVLVEEEEEEDRVPNQILHNGMPGTPQRSFAALMQSRQPHSSDAPSNASSDSAPASAVGVPVFLSAAFRTPSRQDTFPSSPFTTPLRERPGDDDEEQVLYQAARPLLDDTFDREISWIADPVPEIRMPVDDVDDDDDDDMADDEPYEEPSESNRSSVGFVHDESYPDDHDQSRASSSKSVVIESEVSPDPQFTVPASPSSVAEYSQTQSLVIASDDSAQLSPRSYPTRLSVASRIQSDRSPINSEFHEWDDRSGGEGLPRRNGEQLWEKVKGAFSRSGSSAGRRSRTNSIVNRDRREPGDSSFNRESGASLTSSKTDRGDSNVRTSLMQSPSASASIVSLSPHLGSRGAASPALASSADLMKYQHEKLFPFPGIIKLEEQRIRAKGMLSASSPDLNGQEEEQPPLSGSFTASAGSPVAARDRKLSHQASDTRLLSKYNSPPISATPSSSSQHEKSPNLSPNSPQSTIGGNGAKHSLPMTLTGVKQWLSKNKNIFSTQSSPSSTPTISPPIFQSGTFPASPSPNANKKPSLSDLLRIRKESDLGADWEEIGNEKSRTPTTAPGSAVSQQSPVLTTPQPPQPPQTPVSPTKALAPVRGESTDTEKTPKARKVMPASDSEPDFSSPYPSWTTTSTFQPLPEPPAPSSPPEPPSSTTPDPTSSLSDYPAATTSTSSSASSSQSRESHFTEQRPPPVESQGHVVLERLEENLARGSRSPMWASAVDDPARKLVLSSPVLQVVNPNTVKDRFLFLFTDILVIAKPVTPDHDSFIDSYKPSPSDRKFVVKSVVQLRQLRFCDDRIEHQSKANYTVPPRNPLIRTFIHQFSKDPDHAISTLFAKTGTRDDPTVLGQLLFKTLDLDRTRLGDYLSRRTSKLVLKSFINSFGFAGMRIDKALRAFLLSINIPSRGPLDHKSMDYLLDSFASRWYEAHAGGIAYDKDLAIRLVRALVQLNELLHEGISQVNGPTRYPRRNITRRDFIEAFRRYDVRYLVTDEVLEEAYNSIKDERLCQARNSALSPPDIFIMVKRPLPTRLTYKVQSEPIILRIPQSDPHLTIHLYGQNLTFDPPTLNFGKSSEVSFRIMGTSLGPKTLIMVRAGPNANLYSGLPLSHSLEVERAFMRNTFQIAFLNHNNCKRRYMFSVDDPLIRHQWAVSLKRQIDSSTNSTNSASNGGRPGPSKFYRAAEHLAFRILQETLLGSDAFSSRLSSKLLDKPSRMSPSPSPSPGRFLVDQRNPTNGSRAAAHIRSKSRSQLYRQGAGRNELDLANSTGSAYEKDSSAEEQYTRVNGPLWSNQELELQCQQNSSIALVLSFLQVGAPDLGKDVLS
ncbi:hypothetical protein CCMSSC00406_0005514 [Pleurotus cornucopiae]|uniref:Uncharacterized protein n=1 Tax=Pleurotus cornucopiae TaxID=5321 RepID=A0ACB7IS11_PLECO|nr:hypothetical protein CCMSSC00406_0005514 [Pleurotus cornucopiae]